MQVPVLQSLMLNTVRLAKLHPACFREQLQGQKQPDCPVRSTEISNEDLLVTVTVRRYMNIPDINSAGQPTVSYVLQNMVK